MKLLICEDDISTIGVLKKQIDFSSFDIDTILEAYNGDMAIKIIDAEKPELILCDIGMPKVDGIEVLKYAYKNSPNSEFCFLTCYEEFEYAQTAIEYKASGYITKPFKLEQVSSTIKKMIENYKRKMKSIEDEDKQTKRDLLYSSLFKRVCDGIYGNDVNMIQNQLDASGVNFKADCPFRIVFSCLNILGTIKSTWSKNLLLYVLTRIPDEIFNDYVGAAHTVTNSNDHLVWCFTFVDGNKDDDYLNSGANELISFCEEHFDVKPVVLISDRFAFYQTADIVCELYEKMRKIKIYDGKIFYQKDDDLELVDKSFVNESQILWYLKNRDYDGYSKYFETIISDTNNDNQLKLIKNEISMFFLTILKDNNLQGKDFFDDEELAKLDKEILTKNNVKKYINKLFILYQSKVLDSYEQDKVISKALQYVDDNYRDDIHREEIADMIYVSPNYFSKLFRRNVGMSFREYVNKLRIEESKRLLLSTNMTISEIAVYIGYFNISYFSTVFHKLVGISPAEFRLNNYKEE